MEVVVVVVVEVGVLLIPLAVREAFVYLSSSSLQSHMTVGQTKPRGFQGCWNAKVSFNSTVPIKVLSNCKNVLFI
jgi:hypothetical protein